MAESGSCFFLQKSSLIPDLHLVIPAYGTVLGIVRTVYTTVVWSVARLLLNALCTVPYGSSVLYSYCTPSFQPVYSRKKSRRRCLDRLARITDSNTSTRQKVTKTWQLLQWSFVSVLDSVLSRCWDSRLAAYPFNVLHKERKQIQSGGGHPFFSV